MLVKRSEVNQCAIVADWECWRFGSDLQAENSSPLCCRNAKPFLLER